MKKMEKPVDESTSRDDKGEEKFFICPRCNSEHAVPGEKSGEELLCPKCVVPLKSKQEKY
jgi:uncharacterized paraquat-inducible protein A